MINSLKKFKNNPPKLTMLKLAIEDLKQVECSPFRVNCDIDAIALLHKKGVDLKQVQYDLQLSGYVNETLNSYLTLQESEVI